MLANLLKMFHDFWNPSYQSDVEDYITSKNPQSSADVDFWLAEYENERRLRSRSIALGNMEF